MTRSSVCDATGCAITTPFRQLQPVLGDGSSVWSPETSRQVFVDAVRVLSIRYHADEARRLANCDGPPDYTYKAAYVEAGTLLKQLK
jgi:hypothetical protein